MSVVPVRAIAELRKITNGPHLTVVDFFAKWCGPCKMIAPQIDKLASSYPYVKFCKVDVDESQELVHEFRIQAMPTFVFFKQGQSIESIQGADYPRIESFVKQHGTPPPPPKIPSDAELEKMNGRQLLTLMAQHSISSVGLPEKSDLIAELKKYRDS